VIVPFMFSCTEDVKCGPCHLNPSLLMLNRKYSPGDSTLIRPFAAPLEVDSFLVTMGWSNVADDLFAVEHTMLGTAHPVLSSWHPSLIFDRSNVS
jgi:hypothetical protein